MTDELQTENDFEANCGLIKLLAVLAQIQTEQKLKEPEQKQLDKSNLLRVHIFQKSD
jgi:DNA-directed RNA polymerase beta subunit